MGAALRAYLAFADDGIYWPDEIYQSLEPAHRLVFGYGMVAWEFIDGARNWTFPGLVAVALRIIATFAGSPGAYLVGMKLAFSAVGVATGWGAYRLGKALGASPTAAACGAAVVLLGAPFIYFSPRAMSETASALPVVLGFAFALDDEASRRKRLFGAALLGLAVCLRLQNGVFCAGLLAWLCARRRWKDAAESFAVLCGFALFYGVLDKLTWGGFFHSAIKYLQFNLIEGRAAQWGTATPGYYVRILLRAMPALAVALAALSLVSLKTWKEKRGPAVLGLFAVGLAFLALHSFTPHKELRFILPVLPLFCALAAVGLTALPSSHGGVARNAGMAVVLCAALYSGARFHELTFGDLGQYEDQRPNASAYDDVGPVNRLLFVANRQADLCGLKIEMVHLAWTGGYTYLHRPVPLYSSFGAPRESGYFNYAITYAQPGEDVFATEAGISLVRLRKGGACAKDPSYSSRLP